MFVLKDNLGETVDVLVVGTLKDGVLLSTSHLNLQIAGNYGSRRRGEGVSTLICAVLDDRRVTDNDEEPKYAQKSIS